MKRKLVQQGASTLMISLPSKWIKQQQLNKGDEIEIQEQEPNLLLSKEQGKIKKQAQLELTNNTESTLRFLITNMYRKGYEKIEIQFKDQEQFNIIKKTLKEYLIGFDIITQTKNNCIIENITEPSPEQFDIILQKILYNIKEMINNTVQRLQGKTTTMDYKEIMQTIHQYDNFCRRTISKKHRKKEIYYWHFLSVINHAPRELYHLNRFLDQKNTKVSKETIALLEKSIEIIDLVIKTYQKKDITLTEQIHKKEKELINTTGYKLLSTKKGAEGVIIYHIMASIRNLYLSTSPLTGILL